MKTILVTIKYQIFRDYPLPIHIQILRPLLDSPFADYYDFNHKNWVVFLVTNHLIIPK